MRSAFIEDSSTISTSQINSEQFLSQINSAQSTVPPMEGDIPVSANEYNSIENYKFFTCAPLHGANEHNTCGSVAAQLILSYHNYYTYRKIISNTYLNGGWNNATNNNDKFNPANYTNPEDNLNACINPSHLSSTVCCSNNDYYNYIISTIEPEALNCNHTSYPECANSGSFPEDVANGLTTILSSIEELNGAFTVITENNILGVSDELSAGRPVIIEMRKNLGASINHWAVAYGQAHYTYPEGHANAGETYSGYITHCGWGDSSCELWVNSAWCRYSIKVAINHTHMLEDTGINVGKYNAREFRCTDCGYREGRVLFNTQDNTLYQANYPLSGTIEVPKTITQFNEQTKTYEEITITGIGTNVFRNNNNITQLNLSTTINNIAPGAFVGCHNMKISIPEVNINYMAQDNIIYNDYGTIIVASGKVSPTVTIPNTVTAILPSAFEGNINLKELKIYGSPNIGNNAFSNCSSLDYVYFYNETPPTLGTNCFYNDSFYAYVQNNTVNTYTIALSAYDTNLIICPINIVATFNANGGTLVGQPTINVEYGRHFTTTTTATRAGYGFYGWADVNGVQYLSATGDSVRTWDKLSNITLYALWAPVDSTYVVKIKDSSHVQWLGVYDNPSKQTEIQIDSIILASNLVEVFRNTYDGYKPYMIFHHFEFINGDIVDWNNLYVLGDVDDELIIVPIWINEVHTISFSNTLSNEMIMDIVGEHNNTITLPTITVAGYTFNGWYDSASGGNKITWTTMPDLTPNAQGNGAITLYSIGTPITYDILYANLLFEGQVASVINSEDFRIPVPNEYVYGTGVSLVDVKASWSSSSQQPQLKFLGWYGNANFTGTKITSISSTSIGDVTLYAKWRYDFSNASRTSAYTITNINRFNNSYDTIYVLPLASRNGLEEIGINKVVINFSIRVKENVASTQRMYVYDSTSSNATCLGSFLINHNSSSYGVITTTIVIDFSALESISNLIIRYGSSDYHGNWEIESMYAEIMFARDVADITTPPFSWVNENPYN